MALQDFCTRDFEFPEIELAAQIWETSGGQTTITHKYMYVCIYIYMGLICRRKFCHVYRSFPSFILKHGQTEMLQICPVSVRSRSIEITQNWLEIAVPSPFFQKSDWTAVSGLSIGSFWV